MKTRRLAVAALAAALAWPALGQTAAPRPIGKAGDWAGTLVGVLSGRTLYTIEKSGALYATDLSSGVWQKLGKPDFANTAFLIDVGTRLATIERDGTLYLVSPADGSWRRSGKPGDWAGTTAAASLGGRLFTTEAGGALYVTDPEAGTWRQLGKLDFAGTRHMFATAGKLFTIETSGALYAVSPTDGSWARVGAAGAWRNVLTGTSTDGRIYTIEQDSALYATDPGTGSRQSLGSFPGTQLVFGSSVGLTTLDAAGSLFAVELSSGAPRAAAPPQAPAAGPAAPASTFRGDPAAAIVGSWVGDPDTMLADPAMKVIGSGNKEMFEGLIAMLRSMQMTITADAITMEVMGDKSPAMGYRVVSRTDNSVVIENITGEDKGKKATILVLDQNHIRLAGEGREANATFLKRK
jgi:hypothetical protein